MPLLSVLSLDEKREKVRENMKSRLFILTNIIRSNGFKNDILNILRLSKEELDDVLEAYYTVAFEEDSEVKLAVLDDVAKSTEKDVDDVMPVFSVASFFISNFGNKYFKEDTTEILAQDLVESKLVPEESTQFIEEFLSQIKSKWETDLKIQVRKDKTTKLSVPIIYDIETTIEFRPVFSDSFQEDDEVKSYNPDCYGVVPIILIKLELDNTAIDYFHFQLNEKSLDELINKLTAAKKEIIIASEFLGLDTKKQLK